MLNYILANDIIDITDVQAKIEMTKREQFLKKHPYEIWLGKDNNYHTYLPDPIKGRIPKKRKNKVDLENLVVDFWKQQQEDPTVESLYRTWVADKVDHREISLGSKNRYDRQFNECMGDFAQRTIKNITVNDIEEFLLNTIRDHKLTAKGYSNLRTIIYGVFKKAKKMNLINFSITEAIHDMDISRKIFRKDIKENDEVVFMKDEVPRIFDYVLNKKEVVDIIDLGLLLLFKTGLRPGELAGMKRIDINNNILYVHRTEIQYVDDNGKNIYDVKDFPKTEAGIRNVVIPDKDMWILRKITTMNPFGEYVFEVNGKRVRTYTFRKRLKQICRNVGIKQKSPNKIRKTYASTLLDANVDTSVIISQMGHTNILTTENYYHKNRNDNQHKLEILNQVREL